MVLRANMRGYQKSCFVGTLCLCGLLGPLSRRFRCRRPLVDTPSMPSQSFRDKPAVDLSGSPVRLLHRQLSIPAVLQAPPIREPKI